jgi:hypothetical protein
LTNLEPLASVETRLRKLSGDEVIANCQASFKENCTAMNTTRSFRRLKPKFQLIPSRLKNVSLPRLGLMLPLLGLAVTGLAWAPHVISPPAAVAYTSRLSLFLNRGPEESFEVFRQRAEIVTRAAVQRSFDADILMTDVVITIVGDYQGIAVPILTLDVSRSDWQLRPDVGYWATYYDAAEGLMSGGMGGM